MASWAQRMHRRAADLGSVVTSCGHPGPGPYPHRLEKVKFGVPLDEVCKNDIPGPLLVLILKINKEAPQRKDVFRAPGHQSAMKKLIHFLQQGRLVNVDNYSVYTIASVLKKFLRKIPNGIFGRDGESELFTIVELNDENEQQIRIHRLITSLPIYTQRLLVLLFGTFRVIASNAVHAQTGMTSEALGVSVAPSFFQSCVSDGKTARMEDVLRFKVATRIMKQMIDQFATYDLFGRDNYEYYARVTGRILKVQDEWICSFRYPPPPRGKSAQQNYAVQLSLEAEKTWLQCECERWGLIAQEESQSTPALLTSSSSAIGNSALSLGIIPEHTLLESCARLSVSLEGPGVFAISHGGDNSFNLNGNRSSAGGGGGDDELRSFVVAAAATTGDDNNDAEDNNENNQYFHHDNNKTIDVNDSKKLGSNSSGNANNRSALISGNKRERKRGGDKANRNTIAETGTTNDDCGDKGSSNGIKYSPSTNSSHSTDSNHHMTMDELRAVNRYAESTKSLSYLPQVHERQAARMRTRSEWFLGGCGGSLELSGCENYHHLQCRCYIGGSTNDIQDTSLEIANTNAMILMFQQQQQQQFQQNQHLQIPNQQCRLFHHHYYQQHNMDTDMTTSNDDQEMSINNGQKSTTTTMLLDPGFSQISVGNFGLSASAESVHYPVRRSSRRGTNLARHHPHRSSSRRNKENGNKINIIVTSGNTQNNLISGVGCTTTINITSPSPSSSIQNSMIDFNSTTNNENDENSVKIRQPQQSHHHHQYNQRRSNSFRQKHTATSNLMTDSNSSISKMCKPRTVSFESTVTTDLQQQELHKIAKLSSPTSSCPIVMSHHHHHQTCGHNQNIMMTTSTNDACVLMDTTVLPLSSTDNNGPLTLTLTSSRSNSQSLFTPSPTSSNMIHSHIEQQQSSDSLLNTTIATTTTTATTSLSTSHLHFKPPRV